MSPPETLTHDESETGFDIPLPVSLEDHAVTSNGFLPDGPPLERLPNSYYSPWESLMDSLPTSLAEHTLRAQVDRLPILSTDHLATEPEWRRACVVLGFLTHAYIWGGDSAAEILPPQLTVPFLAVSSHLGIPPIATYASLNLWNFRTTAAAGGPDLTDPDALQALHTFTGTPDESWFYIVSVAMEAQGAALIPTMLHALEAATSSSSSSSASSSSSVSPDPSPRSDHTAVTDALTTLVRGIAALGKLLERMDERCDPQVFYHRIRPFLAGSRNMAGAGLPRGVFYDEGEGGDGRGRGQWRMLRGGSNGQSSLVQFLDLVLGVEHATAAAGRGGEGGVSFHEEVRGYMPEPHRRFLQVVAERYPGGMKTAVARLLEVGEADDGGLSPAQVALREAFQEATRALAEFRNKHLQIVARYIIIPSRQPNANHGVNLATASSRLASAPQVEGWKGPLGGADAELTGTGGTALLPFLKQSRDETVQAGQLQVQ